MSRPKRESYWRINQCFSMKMLKFAIFSLLSYVNVGFRPFTQPLRPSLYKLNVFPTFILKSKMRQEIPTMKNKDLQMVIFNPSSEKAEELQDGMLSQSPEDIAARKKSNLNKPPLVQLKLLSKSKRWKRALELLHLLIDEGFEGFTDEDKAAAFHCTLSTLGNCKRWEIALEMFRAMPANGVDVNEASYKLTLRACANALRWKEAIELLDEMEDKGIHLDQVALGIVISCCAKARKYKQASQLLQRLIDLGIKPNLVTFNNVLSAYARSGKWQETMDRVKVMSSYGLTPDACTYNNIILACDRAGHWQSAMETLAVMEQTGVKPDVVSYNTVISACSKCKRANEALTILREMDEKGIQPDTITYNSVISALATRGKWESAVELLEELKNRPERGAADQYTYNAAIHACANGLQWELALELMGSMKSQGVSPDTYTYNTVLNAMGRASEHIAARTLLESMCKNGPRPDSVSYASVVTACERANDWEAAVLTFQELRDSGLCVTRHCVSSVIIALGKGGQPDAALDIYYSMVNDGLKPNTFCFSAILRVCERHGRVEEALKLVDEMEAAGCSNLYSYTVAIHACEGAGRFKDACNLIERVQNMEQNIDKGELDLKWDQVNLSQWHRCLKLLGGQEPDSDNETTYRAAVTSCAKVGHWREAKALVKKMEKLGYPRDGLIYSAVIGALEVGGEREQALEMFEEMVSAGVEVDAVSATSALSACAHLGEAKMADRILALAINDGVIPTKKMFLYTLRAAAGCEEPSSEDVLKYLKMMSNSHAKADEHIFVEAMKACNAKGEWEIVVRLLKEMQLEPYLIEPSEKSYFTAMGILEDNQCPAEADKILDVGIKAGVISDPCNQLTLDFYSSRDITPNVVKILTRRVISHLPETLKLLEPEQDLIFITGIGQAGHATFMPTKRPIVIQALEQAQPPIKPDKSFWNPGRVIVRNAELKRWLGFQTKIKSEESQYGDAINADTASSSSGNHAQ